MSDIEQTKHIIKAKYYFDIFDAIINYLRDDPDEFRYEGDYYYQYWYELGLRDYKLVELFCEENHGIRIMNIIVEADISVFDLEDLGLNRIITEKLCIGASIDSAYENFKVMYVGKYLCGF